MAKELSVKILQVNKTTAEWGTTSDVISKGLLCVEFLTDGSVKLKVGDGVNSWTDLPYASEVDLSDYYTKTETDSKITEEIGKLGTILRIKGIVATVELLPASDNQAGDVYFVGTTGETVDNYSEYVYTTENKWEYVGRVQTEVDLSEYAKITYVDSKIKEVSDRVDTIKEDYIKSTDSLILNCTL